MNETFAVGDQVRRIEDDFGQPMDPESGNGRKVWTVTKASITGKMVYLTFARRNGSPIKIVVAAGTVAAA